MRHTWRTRSAWRIWRTRRAWHARAHGPRGAWRTWRAWHAWRTSPQRRAHGIGFGFPEAAHPMTTAEHAQAR
eukprot:7211276-Pyramimonas_sp.AAC.1